MEHRGDEANEMGNNLTMLLFAKPGEFLLQFGSILEELDEFLVLVLFLVSDFEDCCTACHIRSLYIIQTARARPYQPHDDIVVFVFMDVIDSLSNCQKRLQDYVEPVRIGREPGVPGRRDIPTTC